MCLVLICSATFGPLSGFPTEEARACVFGLIVFLLCCVAVSALYLIHAVPWVGLQCVIVCSKDISIYTYIGGFIQSYYQIF